MSREYNREWHRRNAERVNAQRRIRYASDSKYSKNIRTYARLRYELKKDLIKKQTREYSKANPIKARAWKNAWKKRNPETMTLDASRRRAVHRNATPPWVNRNDLLRFYRQAREATSRTGILHHVDHVFPLRHKLFSGLSVPWNLRVVPATINWAKNNRVPASALRR